MALMTFSFTTLLLPVPTSALDVIIDFANLPNLNYERDTDGQSLKKISFADAGAFTGVYTQDGGFEWVHNGTTGTEWFYALDLDSIGGCSNPDDAYAEMSVYVAASSNLYTIYECLVSQGTFTAVAGDTISITVEGGSGFYRKNGEVMREKTGISFTDYFFNFHSNTNGKIADVPIHINGQVTDDDDVQFGNGIEAGDVEVVDVTFYAPD